MLFLYSYFLCEKKKSVTCVMTLFFFFWSRLGNDRLIQDLTKPLLLNDYIKIKTQSSLSTKLSYNYRLCQL